MQEEVHFQRVFYREHTLILISSFTKSTLTPLRNFILMFISLVLGLFRRKIQLELIKDPKMRPNFTRVWFLKKDVQLLTDSQAKLLLQAEGIWGQAVMIQWTLDFYPLKGSIMSSTVTRPQVSTPRKNPFHQVWVSKASNFISRWPKISSEDFSKIAKTLLFSHK
jgi:hypothetical protein